MKKYKLIKTYPSCKTELNSFVYFNNDGYIDESGNIYSHKDIENYPEFWQLEHIFEIGTVINYWFYTGTIHKHVVLHKNEYCWYNGQIQYKITDEQIYNILTNPIIELYPSKIELYKSYDNHVLKVGDLVYLLYLPLDNNSKIPTTTDFRWEIFKDNPQYRLIFRDLEKLKEYLILNKPCLSIKDVQSIYISAKEGYKKGTNGINYFEELKKLVKI